MRQTNIRCKLAYRELCLKTGTPYALEALALFNESEEAFVLKLQMPQPHLYSSADDFLKDYVVYNYLRKYVGLDTKIDKKEVALSKWIAAEEQCSKTNKKVNSGSYLGYEVETALFRARNKIARVLGLFSFDKVLRGTGMGPGASFDVSRRSKPGNKFSLPISVTKTALPYCKAWLENDPHFAFSRDRGLLPSGPYSLLPHNFNVVEGNRLTFVPKDSSVDRPISIEPTFNIFLQKGVGAYIRRKLKGFGVDLDSQARNQDLARNAQSLGLATLDLSSASDTVCLDLVETLLPPDWFTYLNDIRSQNTLFKGEWLPLSKFSSMGNGFTFELETLIFWALSPDDSPNVSVYGDDIICTQSKSLEYITILEGLGFSINKAKSFTEGRFFESCGKHFFDGIEVTPCYQKEIISSAHSYVRAFNRLFSLADRSGIPLYEDIGNAHYKETYPHKVKPYVPHFSDDRGFRTYDYSSFKYDRNRGFRFPVLKTPKLKTKVFQEGLLSLKLRSPNQFIFGPCGKNIYLAGLERDSKLTSSWIQPFPLGSDWTP